MKDKLEVGMYAYSKQSRDYGIGKIVNIHTNGFAHQEVEIQYTDVKISTRYDYVIGSFNLIELVEEKDLLVDTKNNLYVVDRVEGDYVFTTSKNEYGLIITLVDYQIKSIITKEQFESMQYKVGE